ncbi:MAG: hypothetical protein V1738_01105 [Patescibacteria group bacterium]
MKREAAVILAVLALTMTLTACEAEQQVCAFLEDKVQVCRSADEAAASCDERSLVLGGEGYVTLFGLTGWRYNTLDELLLIFELLDEQSIIEEEQFAGTDWFIQLFLVDNESEPYYMFYGWRTLIVNGATIEDLKSRQVTFWGIWTNDDTETMRWHLQAYAEAIELM